MNAAVNAKPRAVGLNNKIQGLRSPLLRGRTVAAVVLLTVTVNAYEPEAPVGTVDEETVQFDGAGAPVQLRATLSPKPLAGDTWRLYVAVCPAEITVDTEQFPFAGQLFPVAAVREKSVPTPANGIIWGLPLALSVTLRRADRLPTAVGEKVTSIEQLDWGANNEGLTGHEPL